MSFDAQQCADAWNKVHAAISADGTKDQQRIAEVGLCVVAMLLEKNIAYGSSAFEPIGIFAKGNALDLIHARMDDKLARVARGKAMAGEDAVLDLAGYCVLELIARERVVEPPVQAVIE